MSLFSADATKGPVRAVLFAMHHVNHFRKRKLLPGANVINLNSLVSQIVAHNKYGAARDGYLL